ncbi:GyrI-like domain-containing protein [Acidobacteriota bacterium]
MKYDCTLKKLDSQPVMSIRGWTNLEQLSSTIAEYLEQIWKYIEIADGEVVGPPFSRCHQEKGGEIDIEAGVPIRTALPDESVIKSGELPGGEAVVTVHYGPYKRLLEADESLEAWVRQHERAPSGPSWQVYCSNPGEVPNPEEWKTEIVKPLFPRSRRSLRLFRT